MPIRRSLQPTPPGRRPSPAARRPAAPALPRTAAGATLLAGLVLGSLAALPAPARAQAAGRPAEASQRFDIPAGPLGQALTAFAATAGIELSMDATLLQGRHSNGLSGRFTVSEGFAELLRGQGLQPVRAANGSYTLIRPGGPAQPEAATDSRTQLPAVTITASSEPGALPAPYAGGQVARGGRVGMLGNQDVMDTPFNVTAYTSQTIRDQQARGLADLVVNDPSVRTTFAEASFVPTFQIRGFTVSSWDVSLDGLFGVIPPQSAALGIAERVEIMKGASALLNGLPPNASVGGTINIVPKRAQDEPNASITTSYASKSQGGVAVDVGQRFGEDKQWGVRFNGSYRNGDTAVQRQSQELGAMALGLDYRGERVRLSADFGRQSQDMDAPQRGLVLGSSMAVPRLPESNANWSQPWSFADIRDTYYALRGEVDLADNWTLTAAAGGRKNDAYYLFSNPSLLRADGTMTQSYYNYPSVFDTNTQQVGLNGRFSTGPVRHALSISASRYHQEGDSTLQTLGPYLVNLYYPVFSPQPYYTRPSTPKASETDYSGVALADTLSMFDGRLQVMLGVRRQTVKAKNFNTTTGAVTSSYDTSAYTPSIGLVAKPWGPDLSLYANYIEGLQPGTTVGTSYANAGEVLPPYKTKQYEIGIKRDWGRLVTTASVFQITQPSAITTSTNRLEADGEQRNRGIEFNVYGELAHGLRLLGGLMLLDPKMTKTASGTYDGYTAFGVSKTQANIGLEWDTPFAPGLTLSGTVIGTGPMYFDTANRQRGAGWTRLDVGAAYKTRWNDKTVTLRANVRNLFDRAYWTTEGYSGWISLGTPRTVLLSGTIDF